MATALSEKKNVIVIGGAGFIGSFMCETLLKDGARVLCIDNLIGGQMMNIEILLANPNFAFIRADICDPLALESIAELERFKIPFQGVQEIYFLASPMSARHFEDQRLQTLLTHSAGLKQSLDWATHYQARFVYVSSAGVYGSRINDVAVTEDFVGLVDPLVARSTYDEGKRFGESMVMAYHDRLQTDARIIRLARVYGPRLRLFDGQLITDFVLQALDGVVIEAPTTETFRTTLLYVNDAVSVIIKAAHANSGEIVFNVGHEDELGIGDIIQEIINLTKSSSKIHFVEPIIHIQEVPRLAIARAKQQLGWMPLVRLENGLQHTIDYVIANRHRLEYEKV